MTWRKSTYTNPSGCCVEVAAGPEAVAVRDSKDPDGPQLLVTRLGFAAFVGDVKAGRHDRG